MALRVIVAGGGISGLATAYRIQEGARERGIPLDITVLESEDRLGGKVKSDLVDGYLCETGPPGFLDNKPEALELWKHLGMDREFVPAHEATKHRYVFVDGRLQKLPESPPAFLASGMLSWRSKLRVLLEPWTHPGPEGVDESIAQFARRHIGREAVDKLIGALVTGLYAGDPEKLSLKSSFPVMVDLEKEGDGSLIRAMIRRRRSKRGAGAGSAEDPSAPRIEGAVGSRARLTTFHGGMFTGVNGLAEALEATVELGKKVVGVDRKTKRARTVYLLELDQGQPIEADAVILAIPAYAAAPALAGIDPELSGLVSAIPYVPIVVVCTGYERSRVTHHLEGFGFLAPPREKRRILGSIWTSSVFPEQAPQGRALLRTMVGGTTNPQAIDLGDDQALSLVQEELKAVMGFDAEPDMVRIYRHSQAIPQYVVGHGERLSRIDKRLEGHPGLFLTGNPYRGISFNDCMANAWPVANRVLDYLST